MTGPEIKKQIEINNKNIDENMSPDTFVLNKLVCEKMAQNVELQMQCNHEFDENGVCIWCSLMERMRND